MNIGEPSGRRRSLRIAHDAVLKDAMTESIAIVLATPRRAHRRPNARARPQRLRRGES